MIVFLYGPDSYHRGEKERFLVNEYRKKHSGYSISRFDAADGSRLLDVRESLKSISLFDPKTLVIFNARDCNALNTKEDAAWLKEVAADPVAILFIVADCAPPRAFAFLLKSPIHVQEFPVLLGEAFRLFAEGEAHRRGLTIKLSTLSALCEEYSGDSWGLVNEIERRSLAVFDDSGKTITTGDFISIIKALAYGKARIGERVVILERSLIAHDPAKIFNVLSAFVSGGEKRRMADYDARIKLGTLDYDAALLDFVLSS